jgi:hypothetical protein
MKKEVSLDYLDRQLTKSVRMLDYCARLVHDLDFNRQENMRKIADALVLIFEIQNQIYEQRPDLTPEHLKKEWNRPRPGTRAPEDELRFLKGEAERIKHELAKNEDGGHKQYLAWIERRISELEETAK